jgi:hypothetical protein
MNVNANAEADASLCSSCSSATGISTFCLLPVGDYFGRGPSQGVKEADNCGVLL